MAYKQSLLWEVTNSSGSISYVFGSIHAGSPEFDTLKSSIQPFIEKCNHCAIEISIDEAVRQDLSHFHTIKDSKSPVDFINPKKWNRLRDNVSRHFSIDLESLEVYKPLVIFNIIVQKLLFVSEDLILDEWIWQLARSKNKNLHGLESVTDHYNTLNKIPTSIQYKIFYSSLKNISDFKKKYKKLMDYYLNQDIRNLYLNAKKSSGSARHVLITERNKVIFEKMKLLFNYESTFAAVGAAHLFGKFGILHLLKQNSFKIKPIKINIK